MDIIVAYCERWDTPLKTSKHHFISRLAKDNHRILYIEMPTNPFGILRHYKEYKLKIRPRIRTKCENVDKNIWVMTGFFPLPFHPALGPIFDSLIVNSINQFLFLSKLKYIIRCLKFKKPIFLSYYPFHQPILKKLDLSKIVFHMVDEWQGMNGIPKKMKYLTRSLLKEADLTIVPSRVLFDKYKKFANRIEYLEHGTDYELFSKLSDKKSRLKDKIQKLPGKKVGYYGALHKLDFNLICKVANLNKDKSFVFIGPLAGSQGTSNKLNKLIFPTNVFFFGEVDRTELPSFLCALDVFWMPFMINNLNHAMSPIKLYEVLSSGKPIVCSDLTELKKMGRNLVLFARDYDQHSIKINEAILSDSESKHRLRRITMKKYDWNDRYKIFSKLLLS